MKSITLNANAKLNIFLDITGKREDGYHDIFTEMQEIDLGDVVTIESTESQTGISIDCNNSAIPNDERNVAYRAAELFMRELGVDLGVRITIIKKIPVMAGLGGSSTDGAAVLKGLNLICGGVFTERELLKLGGRLGADVPFCIVGGRAECRGIGDVITKLPDLKSLFYAIVKPDFGCDTRNAYSLYSPGIKRILPNLFQQLHNDERINRICDKLISAGAKFASMSGSGSAVFGIFDDLKSAESALESFEMPFKIIAQNVKK